MRIWTHRHYHHHHWQNSSFWAIIFLKGSAKFVFRPSDFYFFGFRTIICFYNATSSALRRTPNLKDQSSVFLSPADRVAQLYLQAPGSLFLAFCHSQGYGGGILTRLHTAYTRMNVPLIQSHVPSNPASSHHTNNTHTSLSHCITLPPQNTGVVRTCLYTTAEALVYRLSPFFSLSVSHRKHCCDDDGVGGRMGGPY
jgi:hypothetical protein